MKSLAADRGEAAEHRLTNELMRERKPRLRTGRDRYQQARLFRFFETLQDRIRVDVEQNPQDLEAENPSDNGCCRQYFPGESAEARQSSRNYEPNAAGGVRLADLKFGAELSRRIVKSPFIFQLMKELFDEEWIAIRLRKYLGNDALRRRLSAQAVQHRGDLAAGKTLEPYLGREAAAHESLQRLCQSRGDVFLCVAISAEHHQWQVRESPRNVIEQGEGRVIGPMKVLEGH